MITKFKSSASFEKFGLMLLLPLNWGGNSATPEFTFARREFGFTAFFDFGAVGELTRGEARGQILN